MYIVTSGSLLRAATRQAWVPAVLIMLVASTTVLAQDAGQIAGICSELGQAGSAYQEARLVAAKAEADYKRAAHTYNQEWRARAERQYRTALERLHQAELDYAATVEKVSKAILTRARQEVADNAELRHAGVQEALTYADGHDRASAETAEVERRREMEKRHRDYLNDLDAQSRQHRLQLDEQYRTSRIATENSSLESRRARQNRELEERRTREGN